MRVTWLAVVLAMLCTICLQNQDAGAAYTFVNIADTTGPYFSFGTPAINANGLVTFRADLDSFHTGIYLGGGGGITTIAHNNGTSFQTFGIQTPGINSAGEVFFAANRTGAAGGGNGIFRGNGNATDTYATSMSPVGMTTFGRPSISPDGEIAFRGSRIEMLGGQIQAGVFAGLNALESSSGIFADFGNGNAEIAVNDNGVVAFTGTLDTGVSGVYIDSAAGGIAGPIADSSGQFSNFVHSSPSINSDGVVAFHATLDAGGDGIFLGSAGETATPLVTAGGGTFSSFAPVASINSEGLVAYSAITVFGAGLFVGPDFVADRILLAGDAMFGSTITAHAISNASLNDAGQLAFRYTLANGVNGIAIATPLQPSLPGDYNGNGIVDAADYTSWRDHLGQAFTLTNENPAAATPGVVDAEDYDFWKLHFGASLGSGSGSRSLVAVPEPATWVLLILAVAGCCPTRRRCGLDSAARPSRQHIHGPF